MNTALLSSSAARQPASVLLALLFILSICGHAAAAPPVNDAFASATALPAALPQTVPATNVDATSQAGEQLPHSMQKSVWWTWTPAVSGWVRFTSGNQDQDTVLAVYTGASLESLNLIIANDDGIYGTPQSDVIVLVQQSQTYRIQAGGYDGWSGAFDLAIVAYEKPPPELESITLSSPTVDVTSSFVDLEVNVTLSSANGFQDLALFVSKPDGETYSTDIYIPTHYISINGSARTYRSTVRMERYLPPGEYTFIVAASHNDGGTAMYGYTTPWPSGVPKSFTVINNGAVDSDPPFVQSITISPPTVDVTTAPKDVTITVRVRSELADLEEFASSVSLLTPDFSEYDRAYLSYRNRLTGDYHDATYHFEVRIPAGSGAGNYPLAFVLLDGTSQYIQYGPEDTPLPAGLPTHLTVINTAGPDQTKPAMASIQISPATVNVSDFGSAQIIVQATDNLSGVIDVFGEGSLCGLKPVGGGPLIPMSFSFYKTAGTETNGTWTTTIYPQAGIPLGQYTINGLYVFDALGNGVGYGDPADGLTPFPAGSPAPVVTFISEAVPGPYQIWMSQFPSLQGADAIRTADPDGDGYPNLVELALGLNPTIHSGPNGTDPNKANAPVISRSGTNLRMEYATVPANLGTGPKTITVTPQRTTDVVQWNTGSTGILGDNRYRVTLNTASAPRAWMRLSVKDPAGQ